MIIGDLSTYIAAKLFRISNEDLLEIINCPNSEWEEAQEDLETKTKMNYLVLYLIVTSSFVISCYFNMIFEQMVGPARYSEWGLLFIMTNIFDLIVFGVLPSKIYLKLSIAIH